MAHFLEDHHNTYCGGAQHTTAPHDAPSPFNKYGMRIVTPFYRANTLEPKLVLDGMRRPGGRPGKPYNENQKWPKPRQ